MMKKVIYIGLVAMATLSSCDDYLSKTPNQGSDEVLNKCEQVEALFNNSEFFTSSGVIPATSSDDYGMTCGMYDCLGYLGTDVLCGIGWTIDGLDSSGYDEAWEKEFNRIFLANLILNNLDEIQDLTDEKRIEFMAQAHFVRASAYWELVNRYCRPFVSENLSSLGMPLKRTTSYEESLERASLQDTYKFIEDDLLNALNTNQTEVGKRWIVSKPAVHAMLARFYLFTQNYNQALYHAREAMKSNIVVLQDYNQLSTIEMTLYNGLGEEVSVIYSELYGYGPVEYTDYQESYFSHIYSMSGQALFPSENLTDIYTEDDLRYTCLFVKGGTLEFGIEGFGQDLLYHKFNNYTYGDILPAGPSVAEMILTEAEALVRTGHWEDGLSAVNRLRNKRFRQGSDYMLTADNQDDALLKILDERHREMPFVNRWYDIRRLAYNETPVDDESICRSFYNIKNGYVDMSEITEYSLPVKSPRYAQPILELEIARSEGQIKQNEY